MYAVADLTFLSNLQPTHFQPVTCWSAIKSNHVTVSFLSSSVPCLSITILSRSISISYSMYNSTTVRSPRSSNTLWLYCIEPIRSTHRGRWHLYLDINLQFHSSIWGIIRHHVDRPSHVNVLLLHLEWSYHRRRLWDVFQNRWRCRYRRNRMRW